VTNECKFPKFLQVFLAVRLGFAVVIIDGRGSDNRGADFEKYLHRRLGCVEIGDQVEGLRHAISAGYPIDPERIAIFGWSYGT
jgi:dipeptidyl aminopeptidase/acylaminoacyl peptidase